MENNFYELVENNKDRESELKEERLKLSNNADLILQKNFYQQYKFLMLTFSKFIEYIVKKYSSLDSKLLNIYIDDINLTNLKHSKIYTFEYIKKFIQSNELGKIRYNVIDWNKDITVKDLIDAYTFGLQKCEQYIVTKNDLKTQYEQLLEEDKKEYSALLTPQFIDFLNTYAKGINENISYKLYYYIQLKLEERNYDINEFDKRDYNDLSYYDDPASWDYCNPDTRFSDFLNSINISGYNSMIIENTSLEDASKSLYEVLIRDIKTIKIVKEEVKKDEPILSRGRAYKEVYTKYKK